MENASKALLIAGAVLIALIIIIIGAYILNNYKSMEMGIQDVKKAEQVKAFNAQYEAYNKKVMRGIDIITLINKAIDYNERNGNDPDPKNRIEIEFTRDTTVDIKDCLTAGNYDFLRYDRQTTSYEYWLTLEVTEDVNDKFGNKIGERKVKGVENFKKGRYFECVEILFNGFEGRVSKMKFKDITKKVLEVNPQALLL